MDINDLEIYKLAREISRDAWEIYKEMDWQIKKVVGDQFITSIDSIGANIAEGFGRFHYLDRNKFNYNSRGSLLESLHWTDLLKERNLIDNQIHESLNGKLRKLMIKLNNYINTTKNINKVDKNK